MGSFVGILGGGPAAIITAYILLNDGFEVQLLTRDSSPGGVWSKERVLDDATLNNVPGEYRFSPLPMPPPSTQNADIRLTGIQLTSYLESFAERFLKDKFRFNVNILNVSRNTDQSIGGWIVSIEDKINAGSQEKLHFDKIVVCTGPFSEPLIPEQLANQMHLFRGPVYHSSEVKAYESEILAASSSGGGSGRIVVIGGRKSAQDVAVHFTTKGKSVSVVFETTDSKVSSSSTIPNFIRRSRFFSVLSPYRDLNTRVERFLHTTRLGGFIIRAVWVALSYMTRRALSIPSSSPLTNSEPLLWSVRHSDEGIGHLNKFYALARTGAIDLIAPARMVAFGDDGKSVILSDGRSILADAVIFATGFSSSWDRIFTKSTMDDIGLSRHPPTPEGLEATKHKWNYTSLKYPPEFYNDGSIQWGSSLYRGIIPAKSIFRRDVAVNGAIWSPNLGYTIEIAAHWISSYFLNDKFLRLPSSIEQTLANTEIEAAWVRKRWPGMLSYANDSCSGLIVGHGWPQFCDELLEDMGFDTNRNGGGLFTWLFKVVDNKDLENLAEERRKQRARY